MFVGEGPGESEDLRGEPFVGRAGQLLTQLIEGIDLTRADVYIANVVKCRPPGNRDPRPDEIEACAPWLDRQLDLVRPRVIVTLGNFATKLLLQTKDGITKIRGREFAFTRAGRHRGADPHAAPVRRPAFGWARARRVACRLRARQAGARCPAVMTTLTTRTAGETEAVGQAIGPLLRVGDLVVLTGDLGAGKTTFTKGLARGLGVEQRVTSPTFTIVQEYDGRVPVAHVDVYRLDRIQELHDLGFEELLDSRVTIVEWGEAIAPVLPPDRIDVRIAMIDRPERDDSSERAVRLDDLRSVEVVTRGPAWRVRRGALDAALASVGGA